MSLQDIENMDLKEEEEIATRKPHLVSIAGGKPPREGDWLAHIEEGRRFVSKRKNDAFLLSFFQVCYNQDGVAVLEVLSEQSQKIWVETVGFSQMNELKKIFNPEEEGSE